MSELKTQRIAVVDTILIYYIILLFSMIGVTLASFLMTIQGANHDTIILVILLMRRS